MAAIGFAGLFYLPALIRQKRRKDKLRMVNYNYYQLSLHFLLAATPDCLRGRIC